MRRVYMVCFMPRQTSSADDTETRYAAGPEEALHFSSRETAQIDCDALRLVRDQKMQIAGAEYICESFGVEELPDGEFVVFSEVAPNPFPSRGKLGK